MNDAGLHENIDEHAEAVEADGRVGSQPAPPAAGETGGIHFDPR